jgi:uncharacterized protein YegL
MVIRPGGAMAPRALHFIWILDVSDSMNTDNKIQSLNNALREAIPAMQEAARSHPEARVLVRAVKFADGAQWHIPVATPIEDLQWEDLQARGETHLGAALRMVADGLRGLPVERGLPPHLVLISDGFPTDDWKAGLKALMAQPLGYAAIRLAVAIGQDADVKVLEDFIGNREFQVLRANNAASLAQKIIFASRSFARPASGAEPAADSRAWRPNTAFAVGWDILDANQNTQTVATAGTSGPVQPAWQLGEGALTRDGSVVWKNLGGDVW